MFLSQQSPFRSLQWNTRRADLVGLDLLNEDHLFRGGSVRSIAGLMLLFFLSSMLTAMNKAPM